MNLSGRHSAQVASQEEAPAAKPSGDAALPKVGLKMWLQLDEIAETSFSGILLVAMHWADDSVQGPSRSWLPQTQFGGSTPELAVASSIATEVFERDVYVRPATSEVFLWLGLRIAVRANLPLHRFPLDRQQLRVGVTCRGFTMAPWTLQDPPDVDQNLITIPGGCRVDSDVEKFCLVAVLPLFLTSSLGQSYARMLFHVERRASHYALTYGLTTYLIVLIHGCVFSIEPAEAADRLSLSLTLLLTLVAQRFLAVQALPVVNYMTYLDLYSVVALVWLVVGMIEITIVGYDPEEYPRENDVRFHTGSMVIWTVLHVVVLLLQPCLRLPWDRIASQYPRQSLAGTEALD